MQPKLSGSRRPGEESEGETAAFTQEFLNRTPLDDLRLLSGDYWGELRVFLAVAKAGSYSRAAELLSTSQPTVSRQVKRLQDVMRSQLVVSSSTGVKLTPRGKALAEHLAALDHSLFSLSNDLQMEAKSQQGLVRISITEGLGIFFLVPSLRPLSEEHPLIQIDVQNPLNLNDLPPARHAAPDPGRLPRIRGAARCSDPSQSRGPPVHSIPSLSERCRHVGTVEQPRKTGTHRPLLR
jgi:DNA-binding MarR family transcriptional regulator